VCDAVVEGALFWFLRVEWTEPDGSYCQTDYVDLEAKTVPTGFLPKIQDWCRRSNVQLDLCGWPDEQTHQVCPIPGIELHSYQRDAVEKALKCWCGVIEMATGSGKTEVAICLVRSLDTPKTLFLCPDIAAMTEMYNRFRSRDFTLGEVGRIGGRYKEFGCPVSVAVVPTVHAGLKRSKPWALSLLSETELLIVDECHGLSTAASWQRVVAACEAPRRIALSATPWKDERSRWDLLYIQPYDSVLQSHIGEALIYLPATTLQSIGKLTKCDLVVFPGSGETLDNSADYRDVYRLGVVENPYRNHHVVMIAVNLVDQGYVPLISVWELGHGRVLQDLLYRHGVLAACSYGSDVVILPKVLEIEGQAIPKSNKVPLPDDAYTRKMGKWQERHFVKVRARDVDVHRLLEEGSIQVLVGSKIYDQVQNVKCLTDLINAAGLKAHQRWIQKIGRSLRLFEGKTRARIWDAFDTCHRLLRKHSKRRHCVYYEEGFVGEGYTSLAHLFRFTKLSSVVTTVKKERSDMKVTSITVTSALTIPLGKRGSVSPSVTLTAELEDGDDEAKVAAVLSSRSQAIFVQEAAKLSILAQQYNKLPADQVATQYLSSIQTV
jgi:hypothetical protein